MTHFANQKGEKREQNRQGSTKGDIRSFILYARRKEGDSREYHGFCKKKKNKQDLNLFKLLFCISQTPRRQNNLMVFIHRKINIPNQCRHAGHKDNLSHLLPFFLKREESLVLD